VIGHRRILVVGVLGGLVDAGELERYAYEKHAEDDDFVQPGRLYREVMSDADRKHIVGHASDEVSKQTRLRVIAPFEMAG
jgi:catalase